MAIHTYYVDGFKYSTDDSKIEAYDVVIQVETNEIFQVKEVLGEDHLYLDMNGNRHWDNYDPWNCRRIFSTSNEKWMDAIRMSSKLLAEKEMSIMEMPKMSSKKKQIIDISVASKNSTTLSKEYYVASALYISAKGLRHFYEVLGFLAETYPETYLKEFEDLQKESNK